jgi:hypothetical protein
MRRLFQALWAGVVVQLLGELLDARWHATHEEFETASDQLQAHWLLWLGTALTLAAAALAARRLRPEHNPGLDATLAAGTAYVLVASWHLLAHLAGSDPELAHALLLVTKLGILSSVAWATLVWRRDRRAAA